MKSEGARRLLTFRLDQDYFDYCAGLTMTNERFHGLCERLQGFNDGE